MKKNAKKSASYADCVSIYSFSAEVGHLSLLTFQNCSATGDACYYKSRARLKSNQSEFKK